VLLTGQITVYCKHTGMVSNKVYFTSCQFGQTRNSFWIRDSSVVIMTRLWSLANEKLLSIPYGGGGVGGGEFFFSTA
jgi:hypothetical protein